MRAALRTASVALVLVATAFALAPPARATAAPITTTCDVAANGSFEEPVVPAQLPWITSVDTLSGWSVVSGTVDILSSRWVNASDQLQSLDLWGTAPGTVQQTFGGLRPGGVYSFSIDYSGLSASQSRGTVSIDDGSGMRTLATLAPAANANTSRQPYVATWRTYRFSFTAQTGSATVRIANQTAPATMNTGLFIDNFRLTPAVCADHGDAPASYGDAANDFGAPGDAVSLALGTQIDAETVGVPSVGADSDDLTDLDDEDGVRLPLVEYPGHPTEVAVTVTNLGGPATLAGWLDADGDGVFGAGESAQRSIPAGSGTAAYTLTLPAGVGATGHTYARFRVLPESESPSPTGTIAGGEVEDDLVTVAHPSLSLVKSASLAVDAPFAAGQVVTYTFVVTNDGNVPLSGVRLEEQFGGSGPPPDTGSCGGDLAPGAQLTCTASYMLTPEDIGSGGVENIATALGTTVFDDEVRSAPATVDIPGVPQPALAFDKSVSPEVVSAAGEEVTFTYVLRNAGNVILSQPTVVETPDDFTGSGPLPSPSCPDVGGRLLPGERLTCTADYVVTQADVDAGALRNAAAGQAVSPRGATVVTAPSTAVVRIPPAPGLAVVPVADVPRTAKAGDTVPFSFVVANTGNVTLSGVTITSTGFSGTDALPPYSCTPSLDVLQPGQSATCTADYVLTQADVDAGTIENRAVASGSGPDTARVDAFETTATVTVLPAPALTLVKTANPTTVTRAGERVTYTFAVANTGNLTLDGLRIAEGDFTGAGTLSPVTCQAGPFGPGETRTCTAGYDTVAADLLHPSIGNTAQAEATAPGRRRAVSEAATASVVVASVAPPGGGDSGPPTSTGEGEPAAGGPAPTAATGGAAPLADTGTDVWPVLLLAAVAFVAGGGLRRAARHRPRRAR
ncbi:hypothetical protein DOE76_13670 [Leifsonia sp. ku-ls]|nr:hypothetical protein DOE76_13670 [Leifsonia sp. ku-ls]